MPGLHDFACQRNTRNRLLRKDWQSWRAQVVAAVRARRQVKAFIVVVAVVVVAAAAAAVAVVARWFQHWPPPPQLGRRSAAVASAVASSSGESHHGKVVQPTAAKSVLTLTCSEVPTRWPHIRGRQRCCCCCCCCCRTGAAVCLLRRCTPLPLLLQQRLFSTTHTTSGTRGCSPAKMRPPTAAGDAAAGAIATVGRAS